MIPDGNWSDHAGFDNNDGPIKGDGGPSWVGNIANAVGGVGPQTANNCGYWKNTVVLVVWDDWGGYYDDVVPPDCQTDPCTGYSNRTGQPYVYGFRVPLLVVSGYSITPGYISGANIFPPNCLPPNTYCHDFGSILNFIEYAFGTGGNSLGEISPLYHYADALVMDTNQQHPYSLYDFFNFNQQPSPFQAIGPLEYSADCFHRPSDNNCFPIRVAVLEAVQDGLGPVAVQPATGVPDATAKAAAQCTR